MPRDQRVGFVITARNATRRAFRQIFASVRRLRLGLASLIGGVGFAALTSEALNFASSIAAASRRVNVTTSELQALKILAEDINVPFETLVAVLQRIGSNAGAAASGSTLMAENFAKVGVSLDDIQSNDPLRIFRAMADEAQRVGTESFAFRDALRRVGDTEIIRLLPLMAQGGAALGQAVNEIIGAGAVRSEEQIREAARREAELRRLNALALAAVSEQLLRLLPQIESLALTLTELVEKIPEAAAEANQNIQAERAGTTQFFEDVAQARRAPGTMFATAGENLLADIKGLIEFWGDRIGSRGQNGPTLRQ